MTTQSLFLAWQDKNRTRKWFPVGRLDVDQADTAPYRFRYTKGADIARAEAGFDALIDFPEFRKSYKSIDLFPMFKNRVITPGRPDFQEYLRQLALPAAANPIEILSAGGGQRATDDFEVFPKLARQADGSFTARFFLHGTRHLNQPAQQRLEQLTSYEQLYVTLELTNPATGMAVQIQTTDYFMIGWAPRYLVADLMHAMATSPGAFSAHVVQVNPMPAPSKQRLLIQLRGHWPANYEPMSTEEYQPLVA